jgi:FHA domain
MSALALLEIIDRDGHVRQSFPVPHWPLTIGRALDNDVVITDPHVAARHLSIAPTEAGLGIVVGDTRNGVQAGRKRLRSGESTLLAAEAGHDGIDLTAGRTHLRLRLAEQPLAPEVSLAPTTSLARRAGPMAVAAVLLLIAVLFSTWLGTDPDAFGSQAGAAVLKSLLAAAIWCGLWALLSKTFTRQARFGWHLRVFLFATLALLVVSSLPPLLAFAFSWPWASDFAFVADIAVTAAALYFHLLAVEPARRRVLKAVAVTCALVGVALSLWFNLQRTDLFGDELYMSHLFPPALRVARPVPVDRFVDGLAPLQAALDKKAKDPGSGDDGVRGDDDE